MVVFFRSFLGFVFEGFVVVFLCFSVLGGPIVESYFEHFPICWGMFLSIVFVELQGSFFIDFGYILSAFFDMVLQLFAPLVFMIFDNPSNRKLVFHRSRGITFNTFCFCFFDFISSVIFDIRPDAKSQVSVIYSDDGKTIEGLSAVVLSTQHDENVSQEEIKSEVMEKIIKPVVPDEWILDSTNIYINPTGKFVIGGPVGDCGLTGRKIIVDTYGGMARHGGGAFSGKDPSKVDRSAAYASRYVAKNIVAAGLADYCEIQVSYAIGVAKPTSIHVETFNSEKISKDAIVKIVEEEFDLRPKSLINMLDLKRPIYLATAAYGHFGRSDIDLTWEKTDKAADITQ